MVKSGQAATPGKLPPIFPVVIYNGKSPWRAVRDVSELIEPISNGLDAWRPIQRYFLLDEGRVGEEELARADNTLAEIIRLESSPEPEALRLIIARLAQRLKDPRHDSLRRALAVWINRVVLKRLVPGEKIPEATELQEIDNMLAEHVVEWTEKWKQQGQQQGIQQGETKLLRRQLTRRFGPLPDWAETRLAQATTEQCEEWADRLLDADSLEGVLGGFG